MRERRQKDVFAPGITFGRYKIVRRIGRGGMGAVYEATHTELKKRVAIKALHPKMADDPELTVRFLREGESAARIHHPNVVDIYDVGVQDDITYLVMELLDGEDLGVLLKRTGQIKPQATSDLMLPVCAALMAAHDQGVIHRDLKPANIFLARGAHGETNPKVLDFGISKIIDGTPMDGLTSTGAILGTPYYMSPEQAHGGKALDHRSDLYSIGVIVYQCITGARPFVADSMYQVLHRIVAGQFEPPRNVVPEIDPAFEAVVLCAMASRPDDRYATVKELGAALLPFATARIRAVWTPLFDPAAADRWDTESAAAEAARSSSASIAAPAEAALAEPVEASSAALTLNQPRDSSIDIHPPDKRRAMFIAGAVLLVLAAGVVAFGMASTKEEDIIAITVDPTEVAPAEPAVAAKTVEPEEAPARPKVEIYKVSIVAVPAHARIFIDGDEVGTGVYQGQMLMDGRGHRLRIEAKNHKTHTSAFTNMPPEPRIHLESLAPKRRASRTKPRAIAKPAPTKATKKPKTGANDALILR